MKFTKLVLAASVVAALSTAGMANATTTVLGASVIGVPLSFNGSAAPGAFTDYFTFSLPTNGGTGYSAINNVVAVLPSTFLYTTLYTASVYSNVDGIVGNTDDVLLKSTSSVGNELNLSLSPTTAGKYFLKITGATTGTYGGSYNGAITVSAAPVPEPESYAMLLAGLGLMGTIARRRNKASKA